MFYYLITGVRYTGWSKNGYPVLFLG